MIKTVTMQEARQRTNLWLLNDKQVWFADYVTGRFGTVAEGQKRVNRRYPLHGRMIDDAKAFFARRAVEIYPRGLTVDGVGTCPDFAFFQGSKITFVECLTAAWTDWPNLKKKMRLAPFGNLAFVVEKPDAADLPARQRRSLANRLAILSRLHGVYVYDPESRSVSPFG